MWWSNITYTNEDTKSLTYQLVLAIHLPSQRVHKFYLNIGWPNPLHTSEETKCISNCVPANNTKYTSTCDDQTPPIPARTQNISQLMLTQPFRFQRGHKMDINFDWSKPAHNSEDTKYISTCVEHTRPIPARTQNGSQILLTKPLPLRQNVYQLALTKPIPCQRGEKCSSNWIEQTRP